MKKILLLLLSSIFILLIYHYCKQENNNILIISDKIIASKENNKLVYNFTDELKNNPNYNFHVLYKSNYRIKDLSTDLNNNVKIYNQEIKQVIKNKKYIILFLGLEDIINMYNDKILPPKIIKNTINDYKKLLSEIKKINKKIILINYYDININLKELNNELKKISKDLKIQLIDISNYKGANSSLTYNDHLKLSKLINEKLN